MKTWINNFQNKVQINQTNAKQSNCSQVHGKYDIWWAKSHRWHALYRLISSNFVKWFINRKQTRQFESILHYIALFMSICQSKATLYTNFQAKFVSIFMRSTCCQVAQQKSLQYLYAQSWKPQLCINTFPEDAQQLHNPIKYLKSFCRVYHE